MSSLLASPAERVLLESCPSRVAFKPHHIRKRAVPQKRVVLCHRGSMEGGEDADAICYVLQPPATARFRVSLLTGDGLHTEVELPSAQANPGDDIAGGWVEPFCQLALLVKFLPPLPGDEDYLYQSFQDCLYAHMPGGTVVAVQLSALCDLPPSRQGEGVANEGKCPHACRPEVVQRPWTNIPSSKFPGRPAPKAPKLTKKLLENHSFSSEFASASDLSFVTPGTQEDCQVLGLTPSARIAEDATRCGPLQREIVSRSNPHTHHSQDGKIADASNTTSNPSATLSSSSRSSSSIPQTDTTATSSATRKISRIDSSEDAKNIVERMRMRHVSNMRKQRGSLSESKSSFGSSMLGGAGQRLLSDEGQKRNSPLIPGKNDCASDGQPAGNFEGGGISLKEFDSIICESLRRKEPANVQLGGTKNGFDREELAFYRRHMKMDMQRQKEKQQSQRNMMMSNPYRDLVDASNARGRAAAVDRYIEKQSPYMTRTRRSPRRRRTDRNGRSTQRGRQSTTIGNVGGRNARKVRKKVLRRSLRPGEFSDLESTLNLPGYTVNNGDNSSSSEDEDDGRNSLVHGTKDRQSQAMEKLSFETLRCEMTISELNVMRLEPEVKAPNNDSSSEEEHTNQERPVVVHKSDEIEFYRKLIGLPNAEAENPEEDEPGGHDNLNTSNQDDDPDWLQQMDQSKSYLKDYERELRKELAAEFG